MNFCSSGSVMLKKQPAPGPASASANIQNLLYGSQKRHTGSSPAYHGSENGGVTNRNGKISHQSGTSQQVQLGNQLSNGTILNTIYFFLDAIIEKITLPQGNDTSFS